MFLTHSAILALLASASVALSHEQQEVSALFQKYKSSKSAVVKEAPHFRDVSLATPGNTDGHLFYPPMQGQTPNDYHPVAKTLLKEDEPMTYYSWHIHVYFFHEDANVTARTLALRDEFMTTFSITDCQDDCFMGKLFVP